jgi:hypothetical protein
VGELFPGVERGTGAALFEDVLAVGEGKLRVLGLLAFAAGDGAVGKVANARVLRLDRGGEWERVEAARLDVNRVVADAEPASSSERINAVDAAAEQARK